MSDQENENPGGEQMDEIEVSSVTPEESALEASELEVPALEAAESEAPESTVETETPAGEPAVQAEAPAEQAEVAVAAAKPVVAGPEIHREGMDWYIVHTYSGFENKVAESLKARSEAYGFNDRLGQVLIPVEEVVELRNGKKVTSKRMLYPGYVMVQVAMEDEIWHHIKNTPRVTGFVGGGNTPVPLSDAEVDNIFNRQATAAERPRPKLTFEKSETVRIVDGPFTNFQGKVEDINADRNTLRVLVTIFGRATPVELEFLQVEKIN